jgi:photosystem II stability/assembly factor-like uncharacterized protein
MIKDFAYLPAVAIILAISAVAQSGDFTTGAEWSEIDSGLPRTIAGVKSLAVDPATPSTLYAVDSRGRLFRTVDSGSSWKLCGSAVGVSFAVVDPTDSSIMYAATQRGVLKSTDGGESWARADRGLTSDYSTTIAIDPLTPATLYALTTQGIFKSTDAAQTWTKLDTLPSDAPYHFGGQVTIDPVTPSTIYLGLDTNGAEKGILKTTDGGQSWIRLGNATDINPYGLVVDPVTSSTLYARSYKADGNIFKSTDGGQTWIVHAVVPSGASIYSLAIDPVSPSTLYAVYWGSASPRVSGILKSMDSGENWSVLDTGLPPSPDPGFRFVGDVPVLAVSPTQPATVYTGYFHWHPSEFPADGHLVKSTDGGGTWNPADAGLSYVDVHTVAIDPVTPSTIYAGMAGAGSSIPVFKSADGGASWSNLTQFELSDPALYGWISSLLVDSRSPNSIYAAAQTDDGYHAKTKDGGANWTRSGPAPFGALFATVMTLDAADANTIYLGDYDPWGDGEAILYKSVDGGSTWPFSYQWIIGPVNALVIDPTNRVTLYAGVPEGIFRSADGGTNWSNLGLMDVTSLALDPGDPNTIYAAAGGGSYFGPGFLGLFKSTDGGASWATINNGLAGVLDSRSIVTAIAFAPGNPSTVYLATSGSGVYKSLDSGANWEPLNGGLTNLDVRLLAVASNALYAVTSGGIFKAID